MLELVGVSRALGGFDLARSAACTGRLDGRQSLFHRFITTLRASSKALIWLACSAGQAKTCCLGLAIPSLARTPISTPAQRGAGVGSAVDIGSEPVALQWFCPIPAALMGVVPDISRMLCRVGIRSAWTKQSDFSAGSWPPAFLKKGKRCQPGSLGLRMEGNRFPVSCFAICLLPSRFSPRSAAMPSRSAKEVCSLQIARMTMRA